jgi:hypothetical protein
VIAVITINAVNNRELGLLKSLLAVEIVCTTKKKLVTVTTAIKDVAEAPTPTSASYMARICLTQRNVQLFYF